MTKITKGMRNSEGIAPCKHCLKVKKKQIYPRIVEIDELFYPQCPECKSNSPYEFLGWSRASAIRNWNSSMEYHANTQEEC